MVICIGNCRMIHFGSSNGVSETAINASWWNIVFAVCLSGVYQGGGENGQSCQNYTIGKYFWYENAHPHYNYFICSNCVELFTNGTTNVVDNCLYCQAEQYTHTNVDFQGVMSENPHYKLYKCTVCGLSVANYSEPTYLS